MSFAMRYEDDPTAPNFPHREDYDTVTLHESMSTNHTLPDTGSKNLDYTIYDEGVFVGYRYFDTSGKEVSYPFGYGLATRPSATGDWTSPATATTTGLPARSAIRAPGQAAKWCNSTSRRRARICPNRPKSSVPSPARDCSSRERTRR